MQARSEFYSGEGLNAMVHPILAFPTEPLDDAVNFDSNLDLYLNRVVTFFRFFH